MIAARNQQPGDDPRDAERGSQFRRPSLVRRTDYPSFRQALRRHEVQCTCCFAEELIKVCREFIGRLGGPCRLQYSAERLCTKSTGFNLRVSGRYENSPAIYGWE